MLNYDWKEEPNISKISLPGTTTQYALKDTQAREAIDSLGTAAYKSYCDAVTGSTSLPTDLAVKTYVDAEIGKINKFDVVVPNAVAAEIPEGAVYKDGSTVVTGTLAASASTMYKLYLVKNSDAGAGAHVEYITLRKGSGTTADPYTYSWEQIGSTVVDLTNYVQKSTQIAGISINTGITKADLQDALDIPGATAVETASGTITVAGTTVTGQSATGTPQVSLTGALSEVSTALTSSGNYTPVGTNSTSSVSINSSNATVVNTVTYDDTNERICFTTVNVIGAINSATAAAQTFTGTSANIEVSGNYVKTTLGTLAASGSSSTFTVSSFNVPAQNITVTVTPDVG